LTRRFQGAAARAREESVAGAGLEKGAVRGREIGERLEIGERECVESSLEHVLS
jgi:hypothetical protein